MTAILSPDRIVGGTVIEIEHPAGLLRFEECRRSSASSRSQPCTAGMRTAASAGP
jgi:hypothetical protein